VKPSGRISPRARGVTQSQSRSASVIAIAILKPLSGYRRGRPCGAPFFHD
jgi:hypothetical protein